MSFWRSAGLKRHASTVNNHYIIDASALIAIMLREHGHQEVSKHIGFLVISEVNRSEIIGKLHERGVPLANIEKTIDDLTEEAVPFDREQSALTGKMKADIKPHAISFADRACLALAMERKLPVLTADRAWQKLPLPVEIQVIR